MNPKQAGNMLFLNGVDAPGKPTLTAVWLSLAVLLFFLFFCLRAYAFDISRISDASPQFQQCIGEKIGEDVLKSLLDGKEPKDKKLRKKIKKAYKWCAVKTGEAVPKDITLYAGPLFDAMSQIDETVDINTAMSHVREAGVTRLALFARSKKKLHQNEKLVIRIADQNPDLIVLGAPKYFQLSGDISHAYIQATVTGIQKYHYRFIGEILFSHADKKSGKQSRSGERYVDPSRPGTTRLLEAIAPLSIPLMTHWEPYAPDRDFPRFHTLYDAWPHQIFIVPHMGFASPEQVEAFLSRHPNLHMIISKKERLMEDFSDPDKQAAIGSSFLDGFRLRNEWKTILIRYQDRLLFGTDPHMKKLWEKYETTIKHQRIVLGQLPAKVAEKIAHKNAERLYKTGPTPMP